MDDILDDLLNYCDDLQDYLDIDVLKKGKAIYKIHKTNISLKNLEEDKIFEFKVPSSTNPNYYYKIKLDIRNYNLYTFEIEESFYCNCPAHHKYDECKHTAAVSYFFIDYLKNSLHKLLTKQQPNTTPSIQEKVPEEIVSKNKYSFTISRIKNLRYELSKIFGYRFLSLPEQNKFVNWNITNKLITVTQKLKDNEIKINLWTDGNLNFKCTCNCFLKLPCKHIIDTIHYLRDKNEDWFANSYNFNKEKKDIALKLGIDINDKLIEAYQFHIDSNNNTIVTAPKNIISNIEEHTKIFSDLFLLPKQKVTTSLNAQELCFVFHFNTVSGFDNTAFNFVQLLKNKYNEISSSKTLSETYLSSIYTTHISESLLFRIFNVSLPKLAKHYGSEKGISNVSEYHLFSYISDADKMMLRSYVFNNIKLAWADLAQLDKIFYIDEPKNTTYKYFKVATLGTTPYTLNFETNDTEALIGLKVNVCINNKNISEDEGAINYSGFVIINNCIYIPNSFEEFQIIHNIGLGIKLFPKNQSLSFKEKILKPLMQKYDVIVNNQPIVKTEITVEGKGRVLFSEIENKIIVTPQIIYDDYVANIEDTEIREVTENEIKIYNRNATKEKQILEIVKSLHESFAVQNTNYFTIPINDVKQNRWFFNAIEKLQFENIAIYGIDNLKSYKISKTKAKVSLKTSSCIDWFDMQIDIHFGDELVSLSNIKKAIADGSMAVQLKDGSIGFLPLDWAKKYGILLNVGKINQNELKVSKFHFTLIDQLADQIDDEKILLELNDKKSRLANIENVKTKPISKKITATLRPYQNESYTWLQVLDEMRWGACLADDMGLGKTLQAITFLQFVKEKYKKQTSLIICPTSLIYNWEAELQKFAPSMKYNIHYGNNRNNVTKMLGKVDLIITTYGMLRSDIKDFTQTNWHYIVLDESQAIKNPAAQITKATQLLKAHNRIILSGTPLQNNTMDLYAQFQFLNPGLLGNIEYFKQNFSNRIDKNNDLEAAKELKQLIYPFLLRRTKEQVAKDLPEKTETILWCEMDKKQKKVYNEYKEYYRDILLKKIDEVGMARAGIYVIEGLLRLRQICDSPLLVKNEKVVIENSIKLEMLISELTENTGNNKVLVFSQFVEMLKLIAQQLQNNKIEYVMLDGSTTAAKRKEFVQQFQTDETTKVFLMSIKAGGVGLNLTKANYVYIVDPWWNPAVEQQAIDRTHRIGQTQQIFAYKMICKDTVEEKIVQLQQKKKQLTDDIISEDAGFIKKLSRDDVAFLFQ